MPRLCELAPSRRHTARRGIPAVVVLIALVASACEEEEGTPTAPAIREVQEVESDSLAAFSAGAKRIRLPVNQTFRGGLAFGITQVGRGSVGLFRINNTGSTSDALVARTNSVTGSAFHAVSDGGGRAGNFLITKTTNTAPVIEARTEGTGPAGVFVINNPASERGTLEVFKRGGRGAAIQASITGGAPGVVPAVARLIVTSGSIGTAVDASNSGFGPAGAFEIRNGLNDSPGIQAKTIGPGLAGYFEGTTQGVQIVTQSGTGLSVLGGSKQAVVRTPSGARSLYSEEATEVWFADYGFGKLTNGRARILIDPGFAQTVTLDDPYHVFVQPYGDAELYVQERTNLGFVVRARAGEQNVEFGYRVVGKRRGFETERLEHASWADGNPELKTQGD